MSPRNKEVSSHVPDLPVQEVATPEIKKLDNGKFMACRDSRRRDGSGKLRYQRKAPTNEFDTEDEAIAYILDFRATGSTKIP
jgi:hypothetical protein